MPWQRGVANASPVDDHDRAPLAAPATDRSRSRSVARARRGSDIPASTSPASPRAKRRMLTLCAVSVRKSRRKWCCHDGCANRWRGATPSRIRFDRIADREPGDGHPSGAHRRRKPVSTRSRSARA
jgi:hypothetical protein